jgi:RNA polymerase sigma factor FliA
MSRTASPLAEERKQEVIAALVRTSGNQSCAARRLGITLQVLKTYLSKIPPAELPFIKRKPKRKPQLAHSQPIAELRKASPIGDLKVRPEQVARFDLNSVPSELWATYNRDKTDIDSRNALLVYYLPLIKILYDRHSRKRHLPDKVTEDQFFSLAIDGLLEAIERFDASKNVRFLSWATNLVWWRAVDGLRSGDETARSLRVKYKRLQTYINAFKQENHRVPTIDEQCEAMNWSLETQRHVETVYTRASTSLTETIDNPDINAKPGSSAVLANMLVDNRIPPPFTNVQRDMFVEKITRELLIEEKIIVYLYYFKNGTMKQIAETLEMSESRVSQMHSSIMQRLREKYSANEEFALMSA